RRRGLRGRRHGRQAAGRRRGGRRERLRARAAAVGRPRLREHARRPQGLPAALLPARPHPALAVADFDEARLLAARGRVGEAEAVLDAILAREPDQLAALLMKAGLRLDSREGAEALALYERATRAAPESAEAWNGLARCRHALGADAEALAAA